MLLIVGIILLLDFPLIYKILTEGLLIGVYIFIFLGRFGISKRIEGWLDMNEEAKAFIVSTRTSSFISGLGMSFLLFIILFFGGMVWATL